MTRFQHTTYFAGFAAIAWVLTSLPYARFLGEEFIFGAAVCAALAAGAVSFLVPIKMFKRPKFVGLALATLGSFGISLASIALAGVIFGLTTGLNGPITHFAGQLIGQLGLVTATLFVFPPSLIFWLVATVGVWWLHGRVNRPRQIAKLT